ncbi:RraA family protein [Alicyclobacillus fastidiosus]|uniref:Putative 4-hydroxy-4-methyl-2-oxoglutarate aldolase n=1 Tax=Alicyclobacillus fastidiosus TaxID=392011 RepID=A0ABV5A9C2_9BACL|nr:RraA family protein [Alicyclobacillus fastidiosus]WEH10746.1 RraA family protein [Alicyclobacillus fastidiosus]
MTTTKTQREELLALFEGLRVTDVRDGMDWNMMHHYGSVSYDIRPLFRTRVVGIARTARYVPYETFVPTMKPEEYTEWVRWYYSEVCNDPWSKDIEDGDVIVLDQSGVDVGILGSNNTLDCFSRGARGFVTNGGVRDTDEVILQKIPVWSKFISQKMDQGRIRFEAKDVPVNIGGVVVNSGDVIVADGDGVIVVPQGIAPEVAKYARQELENDKKGRRRLYERLGWELDETVR